MRVTLQRQYVGSIEECSRCGGSHEGMYFSPLSGTAEVWAQCPENMQPIVIHVENAEDGGVADMLSRHMTKREEA